MGIVSAITAVFSAIVTGLGAIGITGTAASIVAGVVTAGIAVGTARQLGTYLKPDLGAMGDPGTRIQLPPGTDNKVPVIYGDVYTSGPIIDVNISNQNNTMHYCIVLSEKTDSGSYSIGEIWWNDARLNFSGHTVVSKLDKNATTDSNWNGKIRMRAYAGGTGSANQIFPTTAKVDATTMMPHWTNTAQYTMSDLVFIMVEVDYDAENSLQGLGALSIEVQNSLNNPGEVLLDYMTNSRYGAGLQTADIDTDSLTGSGATSMKSISNELIPYTPAGGGSATRKRYTIDGVLSTFDTVKTNMDKICMASSAFFMFDGKQGKFKIKMNHTEDTSSAFELNDDNIISGIKVQNTSLFDQYNQIQVEFADHQRKDQSNTVFIETAAGNRMANEPDNKLDYRIDMINNNIQAKTLANIDLSQTRNNQILSLGGDHSTLQIDVGDVVKVTNDVYGLTNAEYRVMRIKEKEDESSALTTEMTMIQYNNNIYGNVSVTQTTSNDPGNANVVIPPVIPPIITPPIIFKNIISNAPSKSVSGSGTSCVMTVFKQLPSTYSTVFVTSSTADFVIGDTVTISGASLGGVDTVHDCTFTVDNVSSGLITNPVGNISGTALVYDGDIWGGYIPTAPLANLAVGTQIEDQPASNLAFSNTDVVKDIFTPRELDFKLSLDGLEPGDYSFIASATPVGALPYAGLANFSFRANVVTSDIQGNFNAEEFGTSINYSTKIPENMVAVRKLTIPADLSTGNIVLRGKNTMDTNSGGQIGFTNLKYDWVRINKGDIF